LDASGSTPRPPDTRAGVRWLKKTLGMDRAVFYTVLWRSWSAFVAPINLLFVTTFLSPVAQGFFYTFGSILALQIIFELGLTQLILQFTSHERSQLTWLPDGTLSGDPRAKARLASLLRSSMSWYGAAAVLVVVVVLPAGFLLFGLRAEESQDVAWKVPWILFVLFSATSFALLPVVSVLEGCGLVAEIARMRFSQVATGTLLMWAVLSRGGALLALVAIKATEVAWSLRWILRRRRALLQDLLITRHHTDRIAWREEVWPIQWRTALTWLTSILITPLFNPLLFAFRGPAEAGRMGLSISIIAAINTVGLAWINARGPTFGMLIARRRFEDLDRIFFPALVRSTGVVILGCVMVLLGALYLHRTGHPWSTRILPPGTLTLLLITSVLLHLIYSEAVYLRAHKAEPFVAVAVITSVATGISSYLFAQVYGAAGIAAGYLVWTAAYLVVGSLIFQQKRREWHTSALPRLSEVPR
jgi:hypothetical protein